MSEYLELKAGEILEKEGAIAERMYWVEEGSLRVTTASGKEVGKINGLEFAGEISFLLKENRSATMIAETDCRLLIIDVSSFKRLYERSSTWFRLLVERLCERLLSTNRRVADA